MFDFYSWSLSNNKFPQAINIFISILVDTITVPGHRDSSNLDSDVCGTVASEAFATDKFELSIAFLVLWQFPGIFAIFVYFRLHSMVWWLRSDRLSCSQLSDPSLLAWVAGWVCLYEWMKIVFTIPRVSLTRLLNLYFFIPLELTCYIYTWCNLYLFFFC